MVIANDKDLSTPLADLAVHGDDPPMLHNADWRLAPAEIRRLSRLQPWRTLASICFNWGTIALAIALSVQAESWWAYVLAVIWIGTRQHSLAVHIHDGAHYLLVRNRFWNEVIGEFLMAWPLLFSMKSYRTMHFAHHRHLNTHEDPDFHRNRPDLLAHAKSLKDVLAHLAGFKSNPSDWKNMFSSTPTARSRATAMWTWVRFGYYLAIVIVLSVIGAWPLFLAYWIVPFVMVLFPLMRYRGISEHWAVKNDALLHQARTVTVTPLERLLVYPKYINLHMEHHIYPSIPYYNLPQLHKRLMSQPEYSGNVHITKGVLGTIYEVLTFHLRAHQPSRSCSSDSRDVPETNQ